jgi:hypothetical protein
VGLGVTVAVAVAVGDGCKVKVGSGVGVGVGVGVARAEQPAIPSTKIRAARVNRYFFIDLQLRREDARSIIMHQLPVLAWPS